ncbi:MAG: 2-C-methyl-D-erythritol 4-phosphate cytidylyltransferase [Cellvibrionaceae bacterium]|nr:2-C-methyl-D-erythritol 4-phosphate cytidylyltransferase [Cellvibrionaceae bacterium]
MSNKPRYWAVIPAAGVGARMGADRPKQYLPLAGKTVIEHSIAALVALDSIASITLALAPADPYWPELKISGPIRVVDGGRERADSVLNALRSLQGEADADDWVLVHDAARPCVRHSALLALLAQLAEHPVGGILAHPLADTLKQSDARQQVEATLDRSRIWAAQTPQLFRFGLLLNALEQALQQGLAVTDEASAIEQAGLKAALVDGPADNIKITRPEDLPLAEFILAKHLNEE